MMADTIEAPEHYAGDGEVDCMRAMRSMHVGWVRGMSARTGGKVIAPSSLPAKFIYTSYWVTTAFKYIWRWIGKNGIQDLRKARRCLDYAIAAHEGSDVA